MPTRDKHLEANRVDRIEGDKVVIYDSIGLQPKILKTIEIHTPNGTKYYKLRKTRQGAYLLNK